jgi:hypothetical protein
MFYLSLRIGLLNLRLFVNQKAGHALASGNLFNSQSSHAMARIVVNTNTHACH